MFENFCEFLGMLVVEVEWCSSQLALPCLGRQVVTALHYCQPPGYYTGDYVSPVTSPYYNITLYRRIGEDGNTITRDTSNTSSLSSKEDLSIFHVVIYLQNTLHLKV